METSTVLSCSDFTNVFGINPLRKSQSLFFHGSLGQTGQSKFLVGYSSSFPYLQNGSLQYLKNIPRSPTLNRSNKDFAIFCSPHLGGSPFWPPESSWANWILGVTTIIYVVAQRILTLTKEVDATAETVEKIADTAEKVAEDVEKLAEDVAEKLPEGSELKKVVTFVEKAAKESVKDAQFTEVLMDKVEEVDKNLESLIIKKGPKGGIQISNDQNT